MSLSASSRRTSVLTRPSRPRRRHTTLVVLVALCVLVIVTWCASATSAADAHPSSRSSPPMTDTAQRAAAAAVRTALALETSDDAASSSVTTHVTVESSALQCPSGWTKRITGASASANHQCVRLVSAPAAFIVTPIQTGAACAEAWSLFPPTTPDTHTVGGVLAQREGWYYNYTNAVVSAVSVHSAYENAQLQAFLAAQDITAGASSRFTAPDTVALGGAAGFGDVDWFDGSVDENDETEPYTNFDSTTSWHASSGCIAMHPSSGVWGLVDCHASYYPYVCAFPLDQRVVAAVSDAETITTTTTTTEAPGGGGGQVNLAQRPPVPVPVPACLDGWVPLPASVSSSHAAINSTQDGAMCYKLFAPAASGVGLYGLPNTQAEAYCHTFHPTATLANVLSAEEQEWVLWQVVRSSLEYPSLVSAASASASRTVAVYLGGTFILSGALGQWSGDEYAYANVSATTTTTEGDNAASSSSPAWPTPANKYYSNWAPGQPFTTYGCLGMKIRAESESLETEGMWVSQSCSTMQPFLCSYRNDGSTFAGGGEQTGGNSTTTTTTTTSAPAKGDIACRSGWSLLGTHCYRVLFDNTTDTAVVADANEEDATSSAAVWDAITPATLESRCHAALFRTGSSKRNEAVHASAILTIDESLHVGGLLADARQEWSAGGDSASKALIGVSFRQSGQGGLYLDGRHVLDPVLAQQLWGARQPTLTNGCVAVDEAGWWYAVPCDAVSYRAYVCEYDAPDVDPNPESDGGDDGSGEGGESSTTTTTLPPQEKLPLTERVVSLAGAVHLVVSAGSVGVYTVEARQKDGEVVSASAAQTDGLHFLFSPISPYYYTDLRDATAVGYGTQGQLLQPFQTTGVGALLFNDTTYAACGSWKAQERVSAVQSGHVTVQHTANSEVGVVCVSEDGRHYVPTNITYEVVDAQLRGLVQVPLRGSNVDAASASASSSSSSSWLPPLFYTPEELEEGNRTGAVPILTTVYIERFSSGVLQVAGGAEERLAPLLSATGAAGTTADVNRTVIASALRSVRFASSPACLESDFYFVNATVEVREVSGDYTIVSGGEGGEAAHGTRSVYAIVYSVADVAPTQLAMMQRLSDRSPAVPVEFYVCVAVEKQASASLPWLDLYVQGNGTATPAETDALAQSTAQDRLIGTSSRTRDGAPTLVYTAVPGLKVIVTPPQVSLSGMWALPPQPSAAPRVGLMRVKATTSRPAHNELFEVAHSTNTTAATEPIPSATEVRVSQYSSPVIVLDGTGLRQGMSILLSRDAVWCGRVQPSVPVGQRASAGSGVPSALDTMLAISTVSVVTDDGEEDEASLSSRTLAFVQLTTNHTGMWGFNASDVGQQTMTWHVCYAYSPMTQYIQINPLRIVVERLQITAVTASTTSSKATTSASATPHLQLNAGFSGLLHLWGLDVRYWASNTLQTAQIALAEVLPSSHLDDATYQCASPSLFYQQTGLHLVPPSSSSSGHIGTAASSQVAASLVLSPGFISRESTGPMRVCLSVPQPFAASRRVFAPTDATVDVRPVELMYVGRYAASASATTTISIAEDADEVVFPLAGYGLHADMIPFLSAQPCRSQTSTSSLVADLVQRQSLVNLTTVAPYDVPQSYWNASGSATTEDPVYLLITKDVLTSQARAEALYGPAATRVPLNLCLYVPETDSEVYATQFQFIVKPPEVRHIRNLRQDADLVHEAMREQSFPRGNSTAANDTAVVVYAAYMDLLVEGFGLETSAPEMVPAVDCGNASSFLWAAPVKLSALPAATGLSFAESERYVDPQTSTSSWYLSLAQQQTTRSGAEDVNASDLVTRFQWCVRYTTRVNTTTATGTMDGFIPAGIPYQFVIPAVDGFRFGSAIAQYTQVPTQDPVLGEWQQYLLAGPLVTVTYRMGNPLYLLLLPETSACKAVKNGHLNDGTTDDAILLAVNGSMVIVPRFLAVEGLYKFCASAIYPSPASAEEDVEYALQFFELPDMRLEVRDPVYALFSVNRTRRLTVEQGQEWALPIRGSHISNHTLVRLVPTAASCATPMPLGQPDIPIKNQFPSFHPFGDQSQDIIVSPAGPVNQSFYITLEQELLRSLAAPADYRVCFKPNRATNWTASSIMVTVIQHVRRRVYFDYFAADGSEDVVAMSALPPTKLAFPDVTGEAETVNLVGALDRQVTVALWCAASSSPLATTGSVGTGQVPCGTNRRVMFVKPMDDDSDPCFVDPLAVTTTIVRGPYILDDGVLTLPHSVSGPTVDFYPNMTQPWILCLETAPERWREPVAPLFQLQYTDVRLSGFRTLADNASHTTALFPETTLTRAAADVARREAALTLDRTEAEGNQTLVLHAEDSSQVYYLNGYGVQRGQRIRFGRRCTTNLTQDELDAHEGNMTEAVMSVQGVNSTLWFSTPLLVEDDLGTVLFPQEYLLKEESEALPMCLSTDHGLTYRQTKLSLRVLPSVLVRDLPMTDEDAIQTLLADTLLVPLASYGELTVTGMAAHLSAQFNASRASRTANGTAAEEAEAINATTHVIFPVGTQIVLSSSCAYNVEQLPVVTVTKGADQLTLTRNHTRTATYQRLRLCVRLPLGGPYVEEKAEKNENEGPWWEDDEAYMQDGLVSLAGYVDTGLYLRVLDVRLESISVHPWLRNAAVVESGVQNVLVRRQEEALALALDMRRGESKAAAPLTTATTADDDDDVSVGKTTLSLSDQRKEEMLRFLDDPDALVLFSLAQVRLGGATSCGATTTTAAAAAAQITTYDRIRAAFADSTLRVSSSDGLDALHLIGYFPSPAATNSSPVVYEPWAPGALCLSVDGGRHFLQVGVGYITADWAPTLRVHVEASADQEMDVAAITAEQFADTLQLYEQTSVYAVMTDTRYDTRFGTPTGTGGMATTNTITSSAARNYLARMTVDSLWVGFVNHTGFVAQGELYMPAIRLADLVVDNSTAATTETTTGSIASAEAWLRAEATRAGATAPLVFSAGARWATQPTGLELQVDPVHLSCLGSDAFPVTEAFVRRVDSGLLLSVPHSCGFGLQDGVSLRLVRADAVTDDDALLCDEPEVERAYVLNVRAMWPRAWAAFAEVRNSLAAEDMDTRAVYLQFPTDLAYVPDGAYRLCIKKTLAYEVAQKAQRAAVYVATPVRVIVDSGEQVRRVAGSEGGLLAVSQGSNARLTLEGSAVGLASVPLLVTFASVTPLALAESVSLSHGCADIPQMRSPLTGATTLNVTTLMATAPDAAVLTAPWLLASVDGQVEIPARYLRTATAHTLLFVCYSTDFGLTFRAAGVDVGKSDDPLLLAIMPPVVTGLAVNASASMADNSANLYGPRFGFNASVMTPSVLRLQRVVPINETTVRGDADAQPASVYAPTRPSLNAPDVSVMAGLPSYYYAPTSAVIGNGMGVRSGRQWWSADARNTTPLTTSTAMQTPTFAAAVAFVRTSVIGQSCSGTPVANITNATLALPVVLMRLDTGSVWTSADEAFLAVVAARMNGTDAIDTMNPVLANTAWRNATRELAAQDASGVVSFESLMGRAASAANVTGESLLVCVSVDGESFHSANGALPTPVRDVLASASTSSPSSEEADASSEVVWKRLAVVSPVTSSAARPFSHWSSTPLWVRPDTSMTGSLHMRDAVLHMQVIVRPNLTTLTTFAGSAVVEALITGDAAEVSRLALEESAATLAAFQLALADAIETDPSILSVELTPTGAVVVPSVVTPTTTTTTTTTAVPLVNETDEAAANESAVEAMAKRIDALSDVTQVAALAADAEGLPLPVYVLTIGVTSDAFWTNKTNQARALAASPDLLLRVASVLSGNTSQYGVLGALLSPATKAYAASLNLSAGVRAYYVSTISTNVTMGTGEDLHTINQTAPSRFPATPAAEKQWRDAFLRIPFAALTAVPIPDAPDNDTSTKAGWWTIPLLLIFPILIGLGTYYIYTRHLRVVNTQGTPATDTTVTA